MTQPNATQQGREQAAGKTAIRPSRPFERGRCDTAHRHPRLSAEEQRAYDQLVFAFRNLPTQLMMAAHPQTLYGLADSPVALAAWMLDSVFPEEVYQAPQTWAERAYPKLIHYNKLDRGGHFAAWEQPQLLVEELRAAFRRLPH